ncbi:tRNA pseudouridine(55) synthase TruB [uncultured Roseivirga sp.]|uniref:tRNA pseudouridine(55) synthase TruB n=1 Tax=uncultured Roseivirga sp. TaxID=543088 RepID=UPI0030DB68F3|tara:strand:+ start:141 stop:851 length:711 start_codon:yes stop_codon:yes gene_type:complete
MPKSLEIDPSLSKEENFKNGQVILIDKPLEWTSFGVVKKIRYNIGIKKIGHAGTLDPLASGLLILCTGKKTKSIESYMADVKEYTGSFTLGSTTPSYDLESEPTPAVDISHLTAEEIQQNTENFIGEITQIPPIFSAIKVDGKRAYDLARAGKDVELKSRQVTISEFEIVSLDLPKVNFRVVCSKGTYIRTLANDFGEKLGVGAYLSALRRTKIGKHSVDEAWQLEDFINYVKTIE